MAHGSDLTVDADLPILHLASQRLSISIVVKIRETVYLLQSLRYCHKNGDIVVSIQPGIK